MRQGLEAVEVDRYHKDGIVRLGLPSTCQALLNDYLNEASVWLRHFGGVEINPAQLAVEIPKIAKQNRKLIGLLYKVSCRFLSVNRLACDPWLAGVSAQLMKTELVMSCPFVNVRIDLPGEDKYLLEQHQDFPYIQDSQDSITWWIPFTNILEDAGVPSFAYASHKGGVIKVREISYDSTGESGGKSFKIPEECQLPKEVFSKSAPVYFGEAIAFNTLLVHCSEPNLSSIARITLQIRFGNPLSEDSFNRNYPDGLYLGNRFSKSYPEYVNHE